MVDGSTVSHVARLNCEGFLKTVYDRIDPVGEEDLANLERDVNRKYRVSLLSCIGHMLNNVCKTAFDPYESSSAFKFKKCFSRAFFSGGRASATKGKYRGIALSQLLVRATLHVKCPWTNKTPMDR